MTTRYVVTWQQIVDSDSPREAYDAVNKVDKDSGRWRVYRVGRGRLQVAGEPLLEIIDGIEQPDPNPIRSDND